MEYAETQVYVIFLHTATALKIRLIKNNKLDKAKEDKVAANVMASGSLSTKRNQALAAPPTAVCL